MESREWTKLGGMAFFCHEDSCSSLNSDPEWGIYLRKNDIIVVSAQGMLTAHNKALHAEGVYYYTSNKL